MTADAAALFWVAAAGSWLIASTMAISGCASYVEPIHHFANTLVLRAHDFAGISCQLFSGASLRKLCGKELAAPLAAHLEEIQAEKKSSSTSLENYGEEERSGQK